MCPSVITVPEWEMSVLDYVSFNWKFRCGCFLPKYQFLHLSLDRGHQHCKWRFAFCLLVGLLVLLPRIVVFYVFHHCWWAAQLLWAMLQGCISWSPSCNQRDLLMCAAVMGCSSSSTLRNAQAYLIFLANDAGWVTRQKGWLQWCALRKKRRWMVLVPAFGT